MLSRLAALPRLPMLPTYGWLYDWKSMRRAEVLHVMGETAEKTFPPGASQSPLGASVAKIVAILPCS